MKLFTDAQAFIMDKSDDAKTLFTDQETVTLTLPLDQAMSLFAGGCEKKNALPTEQTAFFFKLFGLAAKDPNLTIVTSDENVLANVEAFNQNAEENGLTKVNVEQAETIVETPATKPAPEAKTETAIAMKTAVPVKEQAPAAGEKPKAKKGRPPKTEVVLVDESEGAVEKETTFEDPVMAQIQDKFSNSRNPILRGWTNRKDKITWLKNIFDKTKKKGARSSIIVGLTCQLDKTDVDQIIDEVFALFKELRGYED